ncbi:unnamed protein product [Diamesa hyperborea]
MFVVLALDCIIAEPNLLSFDCIAAYLKSVSIEDTKFENVKIENYNEKCVEAISVYKEQFNKDILIKSKDFQAQSSCISNKLIKSNLVDLTLKHEAFKLLGINDTFDIDDEVVKSYILCDNEMSFNDIFENIFSPPNVIKNSTDYKEEFCIKSYALEQELINSSEYNVDPNPMNITFDELNCNELMDDLIKSLRTEIIAGFLKEYDNSYQSVCANQIVNESKIMDSIVKASVLGLLQINDQQKHKEMNLFVRKFAKLIFDVASC